MHLHILLSLSLFCMFHHFQIFTISIFYHFHFLAYFIALFLHISVIFRICFILYVLHDLCLIDNIYVRCCKNIFIKQMLLFLLDSRHVLTDIFILISLRFLLGQKRKCHAFFKNLVLCKLQLNASKYFIPYFNQVICFIYYSVFPHCYDPMYFVQHVSRFRFRCPCKG